MKVDATDYKDNNVADKCHMLPVCQALCKLF